MKVAIVYDRVNKWGGAERVLLALHALFPNADLYTSVYNKQKAKWADVFTVYPSFLQKSSFARSNHELFAPLMPIVFESFSFDDYDVVISVTSEAAKGIITKGQTKHICICLTPTRYLWSGYTEYFANPILRFLTKPLVWYLRKWDVMAAQRPDTMIAISQTVQKRIHTYYDRDSIIVYPPTQLKTVEEKKGMKSHKHTPSDYYLVVSRLSRLTAYKRVDIAIHAANKLKVPLVIVGSGRDLEYYKNMAGPTVVFAGDVSDEELSEYYKNCKALIFPGNEDFGLVMVEAQAHGKPVIAYKAGGAVEIVKEGKTGEFFDTQNTESLISILKSFDISVYNEIDCIDNSRRFSIDQFNKQINSLVK